MSEASMAIESEQSYSSTADDSDDILAQVEASPIRPKTPVPADNSSDIDAEGEMDMDETVIGGGIVNQRWADDDTESDSDSDSDMSIEGTGVENTDEEMTMDFTVALGGPMPRVAPEGAQRGRVSIGYSVPSAPGLTPSFPGDGTDNESMEMEETVAFGVVYHDESTSSSDNSNRAGDHTATYNMDFTSVGGGINESGMDMTMTTVHGGINDDSAMDMTMTAVHGGINNESAMDMTMTTAHGGLGGESGLDFTTAGGGIAYKNTNVYGTATQMMTNIFAPATTPAPAPKSAAPTPTTRVNIFAPNASTSGIPKPRVSLKPALTPFAPVAPEPEEDEEVPDSPPRRLRGSSATPARPTPGTPGRKGRQSVGTPSFARPTSSSAQKAKEGPASTQKKRNIFGASPEPKDAVHLSRSKSRTPRKSAVGLETAAGVAKKLDFSAPVSIAGTPATTISAATTPKPATPKAPTSKTTTPKPTPNTALAASNIPNATPRVSTTPRAAPPSSLKRTRDEAEVEAEEEELADDDIHRDKRRRSSAAPIASPKSASVSTGEEDMELEESEEATPSTANAEEPWVDERQVTPERDVEERPLPTYTPIQRGTPGRSLGTPRRSLGTPRRSLGPPRRSVLPLEEPDAEPSKPEPEIEPVDLMTHLPSQQAGIEVQNIPLHAFLEMVGISWQDDLIGRKSLAASKMDSLRSLYPKGHEFSLPEYVEANLESVFVSMLSWANSEITSRTMQGKEILTTIEHVCSEENPPVVHDYLAADEDDRGMFESVLLQIKSVTYLRARARWYDWKQSILSERVEADVRGIRDDMLQDAERHRAERETIDRVLPDLRKRRDELEAELAAHRAQVEAVLACDQDEIAALREGIDEQE